MQDTTDTNPLNSKNFSEAAQNVVKFLNTMLGFDLWVVTRANGDDYILLKVEDKGYGATEGMTYKWADTFCSRMVTGNGPNFSPDFSQTPEYLATPFYEFTKPEIKSYMGVPISTSDGELFGTLCAIDSKTREKTLISQLPMVQTFASLLGSLVTAELEAQKEKRRAERAEAESLTDILTNLYNKRGWDMLIKAEETRAKQYGHHLCAISIDLDNLKKINDSQGHAKGSEYISKAGKAIQETIFPNDIASRTGGDEFNILLVECDETKAQTVVGNLNRAFAAYGVEASIGMAPFNHIENVAQAIDRADQRMYEYKKAKKDIFKS